ncbi:MAG: hypothetical protein WAL52_19190 [Candidatus Sulfotelmatobacter sp.]
MRKRKIAASKIAEIKTPETKTSTTTIAIRNTAAFAIALASLIFCTAAHAQIGHPPASPTMNGAHELHITDREMPTPIRQLDPVRLQKDALALATAAGSIPADIESVRKGMLPKEIILKLKQIEKLSKQLRNELNP